MNLTRKQLLFWFCVLLGGVTVMVYLPVGTHQFICVDDDQYITANSHVTSGVSWPNLSWAVTSTYACNWHPLTWISHMIDCQLFGVNPGAHHLMNVLWHTANTLLVFGLLVRLTGAIWASGFVAAFFGWHPLHVESVAWASERKDVLSTFFVLLTLFAYSAYVRRKSIQSPRPGPSWDHPWRWYSLTTLCFALALLSKPMAVTLPFVLLLLDFWPLERWSLGSLKSSPRAVLLLVLEKAPLFAMSLGASLITYVAQHGGGATATLEASPLLARLANTMVSYTRYLGQAFWPADLAMMYPFVTDLPVGLVVSATLLLFVLTFVFLSLARRHGFFFTGWLWFVGTLVPVIGLVQVGAQSMADRYMYLPSIGLFLVVVWAARRLQEKLGVGHLCGYMGVVAAAACLICTAVQLRYWQNSERLARRSLETMPRNYLAYNLVGRALADIGRKDGALYYFSRSYEIQPNFTEGTYNYATLLAEKGALDEAIIKFTAALKSNPNYVNALHGLGNTYFLAGANPEAEVYLARAVAIAPDEADTRADLGTVYLSDNKVTLAEPQLRGAVVMNPRHVMAQRNLGVALARQGRVKEAAPHFASAVALAPADFEARFNYGLALLDLGQWAAAETQFRAGMALSPSQARFHYRLARCLSAQGKFTAASDEYRNTVALAPDFAEAREELASLLERNL